MGAKICENITLESIDYNQKTGSIEYCLHLSVKKALEKIAKERTSKDAASTFRQLVTSINLN